MRSSVRYFCLLVAFGLLCLRLRGLISGLDSYWALCDFNMYYATAWQAIKGANPYGVHFDTLAIPYNFQWHPATPATTCPPFFALILSPLALFEPTIAWFVWAGLNVFAGCGAFFMAGRMLNPQVRVLEMAGLLLFLFASNSFILNIDLGQVQPLVMLLCVTGWFCLRKGRDVQAGMAFGVAIAIKLYPWLLIPWLFFLRRFRALAFAIITLVFCSALPAFFMGFAVWQDFLLITRPVLEKSITMFSQNYSIFAILKVLANSIWGFVPESGVWSIVIRYVLPSGFLLSLIGYATWVAGRAADRDGEVSLIDQTAVLTISVSFLSMPSAWDHYLIVFCLPLLYLWFVSSQNVLWTAMLFCLWFGIFQVPNTNSSLWLLPESLSWLKKTVEWSAMLGVVTLVIRTIKRNRFPSETKDVFVDELQTIEKKLTANA